MDLTFQVPRQHCSLQHWTLLSQDTSTTGHHCSFGPATSFFLELLVIALHSSPVAYWTSSYLGDSSSSVLCFCFFMMFIGLSWQEYLSGLPFPPPVDHVLSELFTMTHLSWVALHGMAHSFIESCKPLLYKKAVIHEGDNSSYQQKNKKSHIIMLIAAE